MAKRAAAFALVFVAIAALTSAQDGAGPERPTCSTTCSWGSPSA
jgi:hypothetical protein